MKQKYQWIIVALLFLSIVLFLPIGRSFFNIDFDWSTSSEDSVIERNEHVIDSLRQIIKANNDKQRDQDLIITSLTDSITELQYIIKRREYTISNIKKQTNETLNRVSQFNSSDILQWGTERYKDSLTTK